MNKAIRHISDKIERIFGSEHTIKSDNVHELTRNTIIKIIAPDVVDNAYGKLSPRATQVISERLSYMSHWDWKHNLTWSKLLNIDALVGNLIPLPVTRPETYNEQYMDRSPRVARSLFDGKRRIQGAHLMRFHLCAAKVEFILQQLRREYPGETIRWADIGCASGVVLNNVRTVDNNYEFIGVDVCDFTRMKEENSNPLITYHSVDPGDTSILDDKKIHLVTFFEVLEHIFDTSQFIQSYTACAPDYILAGSPYSQTIPVQPAKGHVWAFNEIGFAGLFETLGAEILSHNIEMIGRYSPNGNHDWQTCISSYNHEKNITPSYT